MQNHRLTLEMTESTLMDGSSDTIHILSALRDQGVSLAVDDFGTGYSSLSYLKRFPLDKLKVELLRQQRCDQAQGFHFARGLPVADMEVLLGSSPLR